MAQKSGIVIKYQCKGREHILPGIQLIFCVDVRQLNSGKDAPMGLLLRQGKK